MKFRFNTLGVLPQIIKFFRHKGTGCMIVTFRGVYMFENLLSFTDASLILEKKIMSTMEGESFGGEIHEFIVVTVVDNPLMPIKDKDSFLNNYHRVGRYKHPVTKESVKYISIVLFFDRENLESLSKEAMCTVLAGALIFRLENIDLKIPRKFDYDNFFKKIQLILSGYLKPSTTTLT